MSLTAEVDHVIPAADRPSLKYEWSNLQGLCKWHHNSAKAKLEAHARATDQVEQLPLWCSDPDLRKGIVPIRASPIPLTDLLWPNDLETSAIPLTIVCGPPASGKSTWVQAHADPDDIVIDLDDIMSEILGSRARTPERKRCLPAALRIRNRKLRGLTEATTGRAFFIVGAGAKVERDWWKAKLGAGAVELLPVEPETCKERIRQDTKRQKIVDHLCEAVDKWWLAFEEGKSAFREPESAVA